MTAPSLAYRLQLRAVSRWPKDRLRPDAQLHDAVRRRIVRRRAAAWDESAELEQANALYSLLDGRYAAKYPLAGPLLTPASNPKHYENLLRELDAAPSRGWLARAANFLAGVVRLR